MRLLVNICLSIFLKLSIMYNKPQNQEFVDYVKFFQTNENIVESFYEFQEKLKQAEVIIKKASSNPPTVS